MVTEKKHTDNFSVLTYLEKMEEFVGFSNFDCVFYNDNHKISAESEKRYKKEEKYFVEIDKELKWKNVKFIGGDFLKKPNPDSVNKNFIRYDAEKLIDKILTKCKDEK